MAYSALQESVFRVDGFVFGGWVTFITSVVSCACGGLELAAQGAHVRRGAWWEYAVLAGLIALGMYLTNYSLNVRDATGDSGSRVILSRPLCRSTWITARASSPRAPRRARRAARL